ncbi:MAG TPA: MGMT family protein [Bacillaceae bacterium]
MNSFTEKAVEVLSAIPAGRVASYGQVASLAGNPRSARQVVRILHSMSAKYKLPWHRVVNAKGDIVIGDPDTALLQRQLLKEEGVEVDLGGRVDMQKYRWESDGDWMLF